MKANTSCQTEVNKTVHCLSFQLKRAHYSVSYALGFLSLLNAGNTDFCTAIDNTLLRYPDCGEKCGFSSSADREAMGACGLPENTPENHSWGQLK